MLRLQKELVESKERGIVFLVLCWDLGGREGGQAVLTSFRQPMKLLLTGEPGRSAVFRLPPM